MSGFYLSVYQRFPGFLKKRINPLEYAMRRLVNEAACCARSGRVLDAGAGESRFRRAFEGSAYFALDAAVGDEGWDYSRLDVRGDLAAVPFRSDTFDVVLNLQVLEHVPFPDRVLRELHRVLKPGGTLVLTAPQGWHEHQQPFDYFRFTRFSLSLLLRGAGFSQFDIAPMGGYFNYLGQRLTYIPKILFQGRRGAFRALLFPLELLALGMFCIFLPVLCHYLDGLDRKREFTLGYCCRARKEPNPCN